MGTSFRTTLQRQYVLALFAAASIAGTACAEMDYEFAKALLEHEQYGFKTCDMVERLVVQLEQNAATLTESKLVKATLRRRQAVASSAERAVTLLEEASTLHKEILAGPQTFRLYSVAEQENAPLTRELLHARLKLIADRPDLAPRLRAEAAAAMEATAKTHAAAAAAAYPEFRRWYEKYIELRRKFPERPAPREIFGPLQKTFDVWIVADKRYVSASVEQLDCYDDADPAKKALAVTLAKHCDNKVCDTVLDDFPMLTAWYAFMQGRIYALIQDEAKADEAWSYVRNMETAGLSEEQRKQLVGMKKSIVRDLVRMKLKARKYSDAETVVDDTWVNRDYETMWREDAGKSLMLDYATALVSPPEASTAEFERAIKRLQEMINRERRMADKTPWTCEFARAMAEIARNAPLQPQPMNLAATEWYHVAFGFRLKGDEHYRRFLEAGRDKPDAAPHFERACEEYQNAADGYRCAILECRRGKTDLLTRLTIEPRAWCELALCYLPVRQYCEAVIACQAMRSTFLPQKREKWLAAQMRAVPPREQPKVAAALAELEPLLKSAASWMLAASEEDRKRHRNAGFEIPLDDGEDDPLRDDSRFGDPAYRAAKKDLTAARTLVETARESPATAAQDYRKAEAAFVCAADKFLKVPPSTAACESALYQAGAAFAQAEALWASGKMPAASAEARAAKSRILAAKALDAFQHYEDAVREAAAKSNGGGERLQRLQLQGPVLLARVTLHRATGEWDKAVKSAEAYLEWEQSASPPKSSAPAALLGKFLALVEQAAASPAPACDPYLEEAEAALQEAHARKPDDATTRQFMLEALSRRFIIAAAQAEKSKLSEGAIAGYQRKAALLQEARLNALRDAATLEDHSRVFSLFHKAGDAQKAVEAGKRLIETFEARHLSDEPAVWQGLLAKMLATIKYADLAKWDRCRQDHRVLVDYMYDTREGALQPENDAARPADDRFNANMEKAARQLDSIKRNYPDCQTLNAKLGEGSRAFLAVIEGEIDCRQKLAAVRQLMPSLAIKVAEAMAEAKREDEARTYREIANGEIKKALDLYGDRVDLQLLSARLDMLNGNCAAAVKTLQAIQVSADSESADYFDASKLLSEVQAKQKKWREAADYPEFLWLTAGDRGMVKERWPDIAVFLKRCYANGVPRPAAVKFDE